MFVSRGPRDPRGPRGPRGRSYMFLDGLRGVAFRTALSRKWAHPLLPTPLWSRDSADLEDRKGLCFMRNRCMFALVTFFPAMNLLSRRTPRSHRGVATESPCNAFCIRKHRSEMNRTLGPTPRRVCDSAVWRRTHEAFFLQNRCTLVFVAPFPTLLHVPWRTPRSRFSNTPNEESGHIRYWD